MKWRTSFLINLVIIYLALEIYKGGNLIILGCHVQNVEIGIIRKGRVGSEIHKIVD
jgi:hypothetical protein